MALAAAGLFAPLGPDRLPVPAGISADYPAGLLLTIAILVALRARDRTGEGQLVSTDLLSAAFHANTWKAGAELNRDRVDSVGGVGASEEAIRSSFRTKDGFIEVSAVFSDGLLRVGTVGSAQERARLASNVTRNTGASGTDDASQESRRC